MNTNEMPLPGGTFLLSAGSVKEIPDHDQPEYAVLGRSNVGKSSFINRVLGQAKLAHTSRTPGKTVCANMYQLDNGSRWVDLPGYGYARQSGSERRRLEQLLADYVEQRSQLCGIIWLVDIRHPGTAADTKARLWLDGLSVNILPVFTKSDKVGASDRVKLPREHRKILGLKSEGLIFTATKGSSRERFWNFFREWEASVS